MVFELLFQSDQAGENSGSVGGNLGENSLSLWLGSAGKKGRLLGESKVLSDGLVLAS